MTEYVDIPVARIKQNIGEFYIGRILAKDFRTMWSADLLRLNDLRMQQYVGYQRAIKEDRLGEIRDYLSTPAATFPNAIVVSVESEAVESLHELQIAVGTAATHRVEETEEETEEPPPPPPTPPSGLYLMRVKKDSAAFRVIDGQHRAASLEAAPDDFEVVLTIFIDVELGMAAEIFRRINATQRQVNPSIAFQLFGYATGRSPQKTAHDIATALNAADKSPFEKRLKLIGTKDELGGTLSQATFSKHLMTLYSKKYASDEHALLRGDPLPDDGTPLRKHFQKGPDGDVEILKTVWVWFAAVRAAFPEYWDGQVPHQILSKTTGYVALCNTLGEWVKVHGWPDGTKGRSNPPDFAALRGRFAAPGKRFVSENYPPGGRGEGKLEREFRDALQLPQRRGAIVAEGT